MNEMGQKNIFCKIACTAVTRPILLRTFGFGKCQQCLRIHASLLWSDNTLRNAYGWYYKPILNLILQWSLGNVFSCCAGLLYDTSGDYHNAFYLAGSSVLLSAFICYPLGIINRWEKERNSKN